MVETTVLDSHVRSATTVARERIARIFRYLRALNQHRSPAVRLLREQQWSMWLRELPEHPAVVFDNDPAADPSDVVLRVRRPDLTSAPPPPPELAPWITEWTDPVRPFVVKESINEEVNGQVQTIRFESAPERTSALLSWKTRWERWASAERPVRRAMKLFESLYELHGRLEREGERLELVLGDGVLSWKRDDGSVFHPVLLQRVQLTFDAAVPEFVVTDSSLDVELYTALFNTMADVDARALAKCRDELALGDYSPRGGDDTSGFLRRLAVMISARTVFDSSVAPSEDADPPAIGRQPVFFLRERNLGFAKALEDILKDVQEREDFSPALLRIVGLDPPEVDDESLPPSPTDEVEDVLLSKPANPEQVQIARRLHRHGCVLVQGPPGTGKTHTIANLIGHLLAHGKSVLVTSHTSKALKVLRDQVVEPLRPLCVSVLENDLESRRQLEGAVQAIAEKLSSADAGQLEREATVLDEARGKTIQALRGAREALLDARAAEYRPITLGGKAWAPADAARRVGSDADHHGWIHGEIVSGAVLSLSQAEIDELYATNDTLSADNEADLSVPLPAPGELIPPSSFGTLVQQTREAHAKVTGVRRELWSSDPAGIDPSVLNGLARMCEAATLGMEAAWKVAAVSAGTAGPEHEKVWQSLIERIEAALDVTARTREVILEYAPVPSSEVPPDEQLKVLGEIIDRLRKGGRLTRIRMLTKASWKRVIASSAVGTGKPHDVVHFEALLAELQVRQARAVLKARWERQMVPLGAPLAVELGDAPEQTCRQYIAQIRLGLGWNDGTWKPLRDQLVAVGLAWDRLVEEQAACLGEHGPLVRLLGAIRGPIAREVAAGARLAELERLKQTRAKLAASISRWGGASSRAGVVRDLAQALNRGDVEQYCRAHARICELAHKRETLDRRFKLLAKLEEVAPGWAAQIRGRSGVHGGSRAPGDAEAAWLWRQLRDELERRSHVRLEDLQSDIETRSNELRRLTADLIEKRAWAGQVRRTSRVQQQALVGWLDLVRRIGKGTGKRVPRLRAEASRRMNECKDAVPVWIMPLAQAAENFQAISRFDVVIIDEASQSDVIALLALYMGKQVVVVGDHEQVSPSAVGQNLAVVQRLIDEHLAGIPNGILYDGQTSVYDLARQSFGGIICLTEHFRCVPAIIEFSNHLSYDGRIKPLREASTSRLLPHVVAHRVRGHATNKVNWDEAQCIVALIAAAIEQPEYAGKSIGVVSLVGEEQALEIERMLRERISPAEYDRRRMLCGNAAQFQGDERDVMFISMVDGPEDGPLAMRTQPMFKQRFNVAASRARDQMWVVHSLDPATDLKTGDLRRLLLEHCVDPLGKRTQIAVVIEAAESPFERAVAEHLVRAGYRVTPQWRVGHYRIDMVVEGNGRRLAVECDGDRYHQLEKLPDDLARQAILERLGWRFVRVRGSAFFREPTTALAPVFHKLNELGIAPAATATGGRCVDSDDELRVRVVRRAEELRRTWAAADIAGTPTTPEPTVTSGASSEKVHPASACPGEVEASSGQAPPARRAAHAAGELPRAATTPRNGVVAASTPSVKPDGDRSNAAFRRLGSTVSKSTSTPRANPGGARTPGPPSSAAPVPAAQTVAPTRSSLHDAVLAALPPAATRCFDCKSERDVLLGFTEPMLRCSSPSCGKKVAVPPEVLSDALASLGLACPKCGASVRLARPNYHPFVGCSRYPDCNGSIQWSGLRGRLPGRR